MITPHELESRIKVSHQENITNLVQKIEAELLNNAKSLGFNDLYASVSVDQYPRFVIDAAIQKCKQSGWNATFHSDQTDGCYINVTKFSTEIQRGGPDDR